MAAVAHLPVTIRNGTMSSLASKQTICMADCARPPVHRGVTVVNNITAVTSSNETVQVSDFGSLRVRGAYVIGCFLPYLFGAAGLGSQTVEGSFSAVPPVVPAWTAGKTKLV